MTLTGYLFRGLLGLLTLAAFAAVVVFWPRLAGRTPAMHLARAGTLVLVNGLVVLTALTQLNAQYLFFTGWDDLLGTVRPAGSSLTSGGTAAVASRVRVPGAVSQGRLPNSLPPLPVRQLGPDRVISFTVHGRLSGITGTVEVRIPAGYLRPAESARRYPVLETFSGYPGSPAQWLRVMHLGTVMDRAAAAGRIGQALIVSPQAEIPPGADTECVNAGPGGPQVETWLAEDVPTWVEHTFRVDPQRSAWSTIGLSAGGYCAAMVAMLHPQQFSTAVVMGGYFRPLFAAGYRPFPAGGPQAARYDLVRLAGQHPPPVAIWMQTSRNDPLSYPTSRPFIAAARAPLAVVATVLQRAGHRMSVWQGRLPSAVNWLGATIPGFAPAGPQTTGPHTNWAAE